MVFPLFAGLLGKVLIGAATAGASAVVTQAFAPKQQQTQTTTSSIDFEKLKSDAANAGFNKLTYLRLVGGAYQTSSTTTVMPKENLAGQIFANAASTLVSGVMNYSPYAEREQGLRIALMEKDLSSFSGSASLGAFGSAPVSRITGSPTPSLWEAGKVTVTNPFKYDNIDPNSADAEVVEQRYGEVVGELGGIKNLILDFYNNYSPFIYSAFNQGLSSLRSKALSATPSTSGQMKRFAQ